MFFKFLLKLGIFLSTYNIFFFKKKILTKYLNATMWNTNFSPPNNITKAKNTINVYQRNEVMFVK